MDSRYSLLPGHPVWSSLRELQLARKHFPSVDQLNDVVSQLRGLEVLKNCPPRWPNASTPHSTLMHITSVVLSCQPQHLSHVELPALEELDWEVPAEKTDQEADPYLQSWDMAFPRLKNLRVKAPNVVWLSRMLLPSFRTFSWTKTVLYPGPCPSFPNLRLESVETLTCDAMCGDRCSFRLWSVPLMCIPSCSHLALLCSAQRIRARLTRPHCRKYVGDSRQAVPFDLGNRRPFRCN